MRCTNSLPDKQTVGYTLLELVAVSGELPADQLCRLPGGDSYKLNVVRVLKSCCGLITVTVCVDTG